MNDEPTATERSIAGRISMVEDDPRVLIVDGVRQFPIPLAVLVAQTTERTLRRWMKKAVSINGQPLQGYRSPVTNELYISELSLSHVENRFIKWPSQKPAGPITLGETDDAIGYLLLSVAAKLVGVSNVTLCGWANKGAAPSTRESLDVVKCSVSDQLYLREGQARTLGEARSNKRTGKR